MSALGRESAGFAGFKVTQSTAWSMTMGSLGSAVSVEIAMEAVNEGESLYGPATQKIAHLSLASLAMVAKDRMYRVWTVVDHAAVARELGASLPALARDLAGHDPGRGGVPWEFGEVRANLAQLAPPRSYPPVPGLPSGLAAWNERLIALWNDRRLDELGALYHADAEGSPPADHPWCQLLTAFPDAVLFVERACVSDEEGARVRVALLWRWIGRHTGLGIGVPPSGYRLHLRGLTHFDLDGGRVVRERVFHDTLGVLEDIERRRRGEP